MRVLRYAIVLLLAGACSEAPTAPPGHVALSPVPAQYAQWWQQVEGCSGLRGDLARVRWRIYMDRDFVRDDNTLTFVDWRLHSIYVTRHSVLQGAPIRYAMLRSLLPGANNPPALYFEDRCKTVVECQANGCD